MKHKFKHGNSRSYHYIKTKEKLTESELENLSSIIPFMPHASYTEEWPTRFSMINLTAFSPKIYKLAANAYDDYGNTVLGVACEYGKRVDIIQKLIDMGAELDKIDENFNAGPRTPIYWSINNKLSYYNPKLIENYKALECLLRNGAKADLNGYPSHINHYDLMPVFLMPKSAQVDYLRNLYTEVRTPIAYAKKRGFSGAVSILEAHSAKESKAPTEDASKEKQTTSLPIREKLEQKTCQTKDENLHTDLSSFGFSASS